MKETIEIKTSQRTEMVDVTARVQQVVDNSGVDDGMVICFVPHTTAGITINENADPDVTTDILGKLNKEIPADEGYRHAEGNSDAHIKSTLVGASQTVLIEAGSLVLGRWQGIYFCEFDGPRRRQLIIRAVPLA